MPTYTILADSSTSRTGAIVSEDNGTQASARAGTGNYGQNLQVGQSAFVATYQSAIGKYSQYYQYDEGYFYFDTSAIPVAETVTSASLSVLATTNNTVVSNTGGFTCEVYQYNWGSYITLGGIFIRNTGAVVSATSGTTLTSASLTPTVGDLLIFSVECDATANPTLSIADTIGGLTWTQITVLAANHTRVSVFYASATHENSGTITITSSVTIVHAVMGYVIYWGVDETTPIPQFASTAVASTTANSVTTTLATTPASTSLVLNNFGMLWGSSTAQTPNVPNGSIVNIGTAGSSPQGQIYQESVSSGTRQTNNFNWVSSTNESGALITLEIKVSASDFVPGANLGALPMVASFVMGAGGSNWSAGAYNTFTENGTNFRSAINKGGATRLISATDLMRNNTSLGGSNKNVASNYNGSSTKLVVTTAAAAASGSLMAMMGVG